MLKELFDAVLATAEKGFRPYVLPVPGMPDDRVFLVKPAGVEVEEKTLPQPPMNARAGNLETLVAVGMLYATGKDQPTPEIWYNHQNVTAYQARELWDDAIVLELHQTERWKLVASLKNKPYDQAEIIKLLRTGLGDAVDPSFLETVRKLIFVQQQKTQAGYEHGKTSMGKAIDAQLSGEVKPPDEIGLSVQVFEEIPYKTYLRAAVDIDPTAGKFYLVPFPGEIEAGLANTMTYIEGRLITMRESYEHKFTIYFGNARAG